MARLPGPEARARIRAGLWRRPTAGVADGWVQANLVIVPSAYSADFREFCARNPRPCPLLDETLTGSPGPAVAPGADLRTDLPRYRIYRDGVLARCGLRLRHDWSGVIRLICPGSSARRWRRSTAAARHG